MAITQKITKAHNAYLNQEDLGVVVEELLQALEVPFLTFRGERHLFFFFNVVGNGT